MAFAPDLRRFAAGALAVAATAVLVWFGTGLHPWWPLMWFAPVPVLILAPRVSWRAAAVAAGAAWLLGTLNLWHYLHGALRVPPPILVQFFAGETLVFVLAVALYRALVRRGAHRWAIVALPSLRVAFEFAPNATSPHGTAGSLAYTQLEFLPVLQLAALTGPWGIAFLVLLVPAALASAWQLRGARRRAFGILGAALGATAAVLVFGALRLAMPSGPTVKVGLVASDPPTSPEVAEEGAATRALLRSYASEARALAARGAQVIVLPEKLGAVTDTRDSDGVFQPIADATGAAIVVGVIRAAAPAAYNEARIYTAGQPVQHHAKHHLLPPFESQFTPGDALTVIRSHGTWGVAICKDMDFTPLSRAYGRAGVELMLVPAWDFVLDRRWHGHMAVMRGVESGFSLVRAAKQGYLTVSDNRGRILAETTSDAAPFATLVADVPAAHDATIYARTGDWFAWLALIGLAASIVQIARRLRGRS